MCGVLFYFTDPSVMHSWQLCMSVTEFFTVNLNISFHKPCVICIGLSTSCHMYWPVHFFVVTEACIRVVSRCFNPLNAELNPICYLLALLAHHILHVSRISVKATEEFFFNGGRAVFYLQ